MPEAAWKGGEKVKLAHSSKAETRFYDGDFFLHDGNVRQELTCPCNQCKSCDTVCRWYRHVHCFSSPHDEIVIAGRRGRIPQNEGY